MTYVLRRMYLGYKWIFGELADPRPTELHLFLMSSPLKPILVILAYSYFCLKLGPLIMANRKPLNLKKTIIAVNVFQIIANLHILYECLLELPGSNWTCMTVDYSNSPNGLKHLRYHHFFLILKLLDLTDTVFFVLRKKKQQVTFLHLYHHIGMFILAWVDVKYLGGGHGIWMGIVNTTVHAIMYTYYTLSVIDEKWRTKAFKKFLTQLQMAQFLTLIVIYGSILFMPDCGYPKFACYVFVPQNVFMFILFSDFYRRCYLQKDKSN